MSAINFSTQICYGVQPATLWEKTLEAADGYLDPLFGNGTKAYVTPDAPVNGNRCVVVYSELPSGPTLATVLKVASYALVIPLLGALILKAVFHTRYQFHTIEAEALLQGDLVVPQEAISKVEAFLQGQTVPEIPLDPTDDRTEPFVIKGYEGLEFRFDICNFAQDRIKTVASAIHAHQLNSLEVPKTRFVRVNGATSPLIAQERSKDKASPLYTNARAGALDRAIDQLMKLMRQTGYTCFDKDSLILRDNHLLLRISHQHYWRHDNLQAVAHFMPRRFGYIGGIFGSFSSIDKPFAIESAKRHGLPFNEAFLRDAITQGYV